MSVPRNCHLLGFLEHKSLSGEGSTKLQFTSVEFPTVAAVIAPLLGSPDTDLLCSGSVMEIPAALTGQRALHLGHTATTDISWIFSHS